MSSDPKPVGGQWHKAARGELSPPKGASEETLVPQLFTASVPDPRTVQRSIDQAVKKKNSLRVPQAFSV